MKIMENEQQKNPEVQEYFGFREVLTYFFRKKDPNRKINFSLKVMHGINKISIITFLLALLFMLGKYLFK